MWRRAVESTEDHEGEEGGDREPYSGQRAVKSRILLRGRKREQKAVEKTEGRRCRRGVNGLTGKKFRHVGK